MNILEHARGIIYDKSEEKDRQYGDFFENMEDAAKIASVMSKKELNAEDVYHCLIGLKFARESNSHKYDNLMDAIAYLASLHEYKNRHNQTEKPEEPTMRNYFGNKCSCTYACVDCLMLYSEDVQTSYEKKVKNEKNL